MDHIRTHLGNRLKQARLEAELKQEQVAHFLQLATSALSAMENGQRKVEAYELFQLSKLYGKPLHWFFEEPHPFAKDAGCRWYDSDPLIREAVSLMQKASPELRKRVAYAVVGFLSDR